MPTFTAVLACPYCQKRERIQQDAKNEEEFDAYVWDKYAKEHGPGKCVEGDPYERQGQKKTAGH